MNEYGIALTDWEALPKAAAAVMAVPHARFRERGVDGLAARLLPGAVFADVKSAFDRAAATAAGLRLWRL